MTRSTPLVPKYPPLQLYALLRSGDQSDWMTIHRFQAHEAWRRAKGSWAKGLLLAHVAVWPIFVVGHAFTQSRHFASAVKRETGKGVLSQFGEMVWLGWIYWVAPKAYYLFGLHRVTHRPLALRYVHRYEAKCRRGYQFVGEPRSEYEPRLGNKGILHDRCRAHGIAVAPSVLRLEGGRIESGALEGGRLPREDLICKPVVGKGGRGIELWQARNSGDYLGTDQRALDPTALMEHFLALSEVQPILVQPRLRNHPDLEGLAGAALSTIRIITAKNEQREIEVTSAALKIAADGAIADNAHMGGLGAPVDLATGHLGAATGLDPLSGRYDVHPTRGFEIVGARLPMWSQALDLVVRAHECFPQRTVLGWDVALTTEGPLILEANVKPGLNLNQIVEDHPLGDTRLGRILAFHISNDISNASRPTASNHR